MARRRGSRRTEPQAKPFDHAFANIDKLEQAVFFRTVTRDFSVADVARYLWPRHIVDALQAAFQFIKPGDRTTAVDTVTGCAAWGGISLTFRLNVQTAGILAPAQGQVVIQDDASAANMIRQAIFDTYHIHNSFGIVRDVVKWLNENATAGAARYYMPTLGSLLPAKHAYHEGNGDRYKEPVNINAISHKMRDATAIIAKGLMCDPENVCNEAKDFYIQFTNSVDDPASEAFFLC